jgi:hypothetical protein
MYRPGLSDSWAEGCSQGCILIAAGQEKRTGSDLLPTASSFRNPREAKLFN